MKRLLNRLLPALLLVGCPDNPTPPTTSPADATVDVGIDVFEHDVRNDAGGGDWTTADDAFTAVDPFIGTGGVGYAYAAMTPAVQVPFGLVKLGPDTTRANNHPANIHHFSGYYSEDPDLRGFSHLHFVGTGAADFGNVRILPTTQDKIDNGVPGFLYEAIDKSAEFAEPGYYRTRLPDAGVTAELTTTDFVGLHRYRADAGISPVVTIDLGSSVTDGGVESATLVADTEHLEGSVTYGGPLTGRGGAFTLFVYGEWSAPSTDVSVWDDAGWQPGQMSATGEKAGAIMTFSGHVDLKIGVSFISIEVARQAVDDAPDFDTAREENARRWKEELGRIRVDGGTDAQRRTFFTALYNTYRMPTQIGEAGRYRAVDQSVRDLPTTTTRHFTDLSLWDTYRTTHPWYALFAPNVQRDALNSLLRAAEIGEVLPRWPAATGYSGAMEGTSADILFAESALKGIDGVDYAAAYRFARTAAMQRLPDSAGYAGRDGIEDYITLGYIAADERDGAASNVLEYAIDDFALANLARFLNESEDAQMFDARAQSFRNIFDPETKFFRARNRDGSFLEPFNPTAYSERSGPYTEGSAHHWRWYVPHDPDGLVELLGGADLFLELLETFMTESKLFDGNKTQLLLPDPYYWHSNQPSLHVPFLFAAIDRFDRLAYWVDAIRDAAYSDQPDGLIGNDDGGTLSAWYLLTACGFYPHVGTDRYALAPPLFPRLQITLQNGAQIEVRRNADVITTVSLNGEIVTELRHAQLANGATIEFD